MSEDRKQRALEIALSLGLGDHDFTGDNYDVAHRRAQRVIDALDADGLLGPSVEEQAVIDRACEWADDDWSGGIGYTVVVNANLDAAVAALRSAGGER